MSEPLHLEGIPKSASEVMIGQRWVKIIGALTFIAGSGLGIAKWIDPAWLEVLANPEVVEVLVVPTLMLLGGVLMPLAQYIRKGRINGGKPCSPIKEIKE